MAPPTRSTSRSGGADSKQDARRGAQGGHGACGDQDRDHDRHDRVRALEPRRQDDRRRHEHGHGPRQVADHVQEGRAHVEALRPRPGEDHGGDDVDERTDRADDEDDAALDLGGLDQAADPLDQHPHGDPDQGRPVDERGEDLGAAHAVAGPPSGGAPGEPAGAEREPDGQRVREHVPGVGDERQAPRDDAAHHLDDGEGDEHREDGRERALPAAAFLGRRARRAQAVVVAVAHGRSFGVGSGRSINSGRTARTASQRPMPSPTPSTRPPTSRTPTML